jgi:hypothetical protein
MTIFAFFGGAGSMSSQETEKRGRMQHARPRMKGAAFINSGDRDLIAATPRMAATVVPGGQAISQDLPDPTP